MRGPVLGRLLVIALVLGAATPAIADDFFTSSPGPLSAAHGSLDDQNHCADCRPRTIDHGGRRNAGRHNNDRDRPRYRVACVRRWFADGLNRRLALREGVPPKQQEILDDVYAAMTRKKRPIPAIDV